MTHGERLGYPVFLTKQLLQQSQDNNLRLRLIYDIACVMKSHLSNPKNGQQHLLQHLQLAIPAFHIYGHKTPCQVLYSTRRQEGYGLTDGEGMERIWAYLRPFYRTTKEMTPSHRMDLLTDAILHYAKRKSSDIEMSICLRMDKAEKALSQANEELQQIISQAPVPVSEEDIIKWDTEEKETILKLKSTPTPAGIPKWKKEYVRKLTEFYALRQEIADTDPEEGGDLGDLAASQSVLRGMREKLSKIEDGHGILRRWRPTDKEFKKCLRQVDEDERTRLLTKARTQACELSFLLGLKAKYADGQAIAIKISRQMTTISGKLEKTCTDYNNIQWPPQQQKRFPSPITPVEARQPNWEVYTSLDLTFMGQEGIPPSVQRNAIDALNKRLRAKEEKQMLKEEMLEVMTHLLLEHQKASQALQGSSKLGEQSELISHLVNLEKRMRDARHLFAKHDLQVTDLPVDYLTRIHMPPSFQPSEVQLELDEPLSEDYPMSSDDII